MQTLLGANGDAATVVRRPSVTGTAIFQYSRLLYRLFFESEKRRRKLHHILCIETPISARNWRRHAPNRFPMFSTSFKLDLEKKVTSVLNATLLWSVYREHHGGKARQVVYKGAHFVRLQERDLDRHEIPAND